MIKLISNEINFVLVTEAKCEDFIMYTSFFSFGKKLSRDHCKLTSDYIKIVLDNEDQLLHVCVVVV